MAGDKYEDYEDDPLYASHHAVESLERRQPGDFDAMLSDVDHRLSDDIARKLAKHGGITDTAQHRVDHEWVKRRRERSEWWIGVLLSAVKGAVASGLIGVLGFVGWAIWTVVKLSILS